MFSWFKYRGQITCDDGSCISIALCCDSRINCADHSDEQDCNLVSFDTTNYLMSSPPNTHESKYMTIAMNISVETIDNFNDNTMSYKMKFSMYLMWYDNRLTFQNLKFVGNGSNMVRKTTLNKIISDWKVIAILVHWNQ